MKIRGIARQIVSDYSLKINLCCRLSFINSLCRRKKIPKVNLTTACLILSLLPTLWNVIILVCLLRRALVQKIYVRRMKLNMTTTAVSWQELSPTDLLRWLYNWHYCWKLHDKNYRKSYAQLVLTKISRNVLLRHAQFWLFPPGWDLWWTEENFIILLKVKVSRSLLRPHFSNAIMVYIQYPQTKFL